MDTSNLPCDHPCFVGERKRETEFCALGAKSYAFNIYAGEKREDGRVGGEKIKAKGIRQHSKPHDS